MIDRMTGAWYPSYPNQTPDQDPDFVWAVLDEAMETLRATEPRFYAGILRRIQSQ